MVGQWERRRGAVDETRQDVGAMNGWGTGGTVSDGRDDGFADGIDAGLGVV